MKLTIKELQSIETDILKEIIEICDRNNIIYYLAYGSVLGAVRHNGPIPWDADADIILPYNELKKFIVIVRKELSDKYFLDYYDINNYFTPTFPRVGLKGYSTVILHVDVFCLCGLPENKNDQRKFAAKISKLKYIHYYKIASEKYRGRMSVKQKIKNSIYKVLYLTHSLSHVRREFDGLCSLYPLNKSKYVANASWINGLNKVEENIFYGEGAFINYSNFKVRIPEQYDRYLKFWYNEYMKYPPVNERCIKEVYHIIKLEL